MPMKTNNAMRKSNSATNMEDIGTMSLGKYIFLIIFALFTILFDALESPVENIFQISKPENTKTGYGIESEGISNAPAKNTVNITIMSRGCKIAQENPRIVCLYFTLISRQVKK